MKKLCLFFFISLSITINFSCNRPQISSETFDITDDSLCAKCKDLSGLGNLKIGVTTIKSLKNDKGITLPKHELTSSFSDNEWGVTLYDFEMKRYIEKKATSISQINITDISYKYKIGEIEIEDVKLAFLNDTLVAISFNCTSEILNYYISKYGNGRGKKYEYLHKKGTYGDENYEYEFKCEEERLWANENVSMIYKQNIRHTDKSNYRNRISGDISCIIYANKKYDIFVNILEEYKTQFLKNKHESKKASLNML